MQILYAIQGTGNGHISRAREIIPILRIHHDVDILVSGTQAEVELPFPIQYSFKGLSFVFGKNGGIDFIETYRKARINVLLAEIKSLSIDRYDLILNDFEPVSAWACFLQNKPCVAISHQAAVVAKKAPRPNKIDLLGKAILKHYAPSIARYGFHFKPYDSHTFTPVIRSQIREQVIENQKHYTVYLPAYDDKRILKVLRRCTEVSWQVFSKHNILEQIYDNIHLQPINNEAFVKSLARCEGVICGAGFETPAEALFLKKKLLVIPMKGQFEQQCNAAALQKMGVPVLKSLKIKQIGKINKWLFSDKKVDVTFPDQTEEILLRIIAQHTVNELTNLENKKAYPSIKKFRRLVLRKIIDQIPTTPQ